MNYLEYKNNKIVLLFKVPIYIGVLKYMPYSLEKYINKKNNLVDIFKLLLKFNNLFVKHRKNDDLDYHFNNIFSLYGTKKYCIKGKILNIFTSTFDYLLDEKIFIIL
jgi:hypothetical protein